MLNIIVRKIMRMDFVRFYIVKESNKACFKSNILIEKWLWVVYNFCVTIYTVFIFGDYFGTYEVKNGKYF